MTLLLLALLAAPDTAAIEEELARLALSRKETLSALEHYEQAMRHVESTREKARLRDLYLAAGWAEPPPVNPVEQGILDEHVRQERIRVQQRAAGAFQGQGRLHAARALKLSVEALHGGDEKAAARVEQEIRDLERRILAPTDEERERSDRIAKGLTTPGNLLRAARQAAARGEPRVGVRLCQEVEFGDHSQEAQNEARALREEIQQRLLADPPEEEAEAARAVIEDPRFEALDVARSRHFLFLGPRDFVRSIPEHERTLLDLAYVYQSDLALMPLTADGTRIVVYFQETFDFGGALAGGELIRVGNRAISLPLAGALLYHELGHCIFGRGWLHDGFTEGLADFAAAFTLDSLGQTGAAQDFVVESKRQFTAYFLGRDVRYEDIQPYRPSAGFLFRFLPPGDAPFDWTPWRRVFRNMREAQFAAWPDRDHQIMRYLGSLLATEYGPETLSMLASWGWPVEPEDLERVPREGADLMPTLQEGEYRLIKGEAKAAVPYLRRVLSADPEGPLAPRAKHGLLQASLALGDEAGAAAMSRELAIVRAWKVLGPYHAHDAEHRLYPPETGLVDLAAPLQVGHETCEWKDAVVNADGYVDLRAQGFAYPEHACAFAVCHLRSDAARPVRVWIGADDGYALYLNGRLLGKRSGVFRLDDDYRDARLEPGWNRLLVKVHNRGGAWGFLLRATDPDGRAMPGVEIRAEAPYVAPAEPDTTRKAAVDEDFRRFSSKRWHVAAGRFDVQNARLRPLSAEPAGVWDRFVVHPDDPPTGPSNIIWLVYDQLPAIRSFDLRVGVAGSLREKFAVTVDGENGNDAQSGHTLVFEPAGDRVACRWYRYDRLLYLQPGVEVPEGDEHEVAIRRAGTHWRVAVDGVPVFDGADAAPLPAWGIGLQTWGRRPEFTRFRLEALD